MSFKKPSNNEAPVFDRPPQNAAKGFFIRRLMSLAGKPVLAEKNLPIQPSHNESAEKCYVNKAALLYRQQGSSAGSRRFKPVICKSLAPQPGSFKGSERGASDFSHIPTFNPLLKTVCANSTSDYPAQMTITKHCLPAVERFENSAEAAVSYSFLTPTAKPYLLGICARLNSIELDRCHGDIARPALFSGFKNILNWQPRAFIYPDSEIIFSSQYSESKKAFVSSLPGSCHFALFPGNYGFLPAEKSFNCNLTQNTYKPLFAIRSSSSAERFDSRNDFAHNLVIVCNSFLRPVEGLNTAFHSETRIFSSSCSSTNRPLSAIPQYAQTPTCSLSASVSRLDAALRISGPLLRNLQSSPGPLRTHRTPGAESFNTNPMLNLACSASRSRMKLRLKLRRAFYAEAGSELQTVQHKPFLAPKMLLPGKIIADYKPLVLAEPASSFAPSYSAGTCPNFALRRSSMRFTSARHAHYCRKALKAILKKDNPCQILTQADCRKNYCSTHDFITPLHYRDRFSTVKPRHEAIGVIYLRSMPFLMKLSAMDFTDIFLPDAQRRATPSNAGFSADLNFLSWRRRSTLKSLRFKLTRITEGFKSSRLPAQRRIPAPVVCFSITDRIRPVKTIETTAGSRAQAIKSYKPVYRGKLERFALSACAPKQILAQLELTMPILGLATEENLDQKHFICPATWGKTEKTYKCRVRLTPHPFGFPEFQLSVDSFSMVESAVSFVYMLLSDKYLQSKDSFAISREKVFLAPLSLKNPRRFLYPENSFSIKPRDYYSAARNLLQGTITTPAKISSFGHDWGLKKTKKLISTFLQRPPAVHIRKKTTDNFAIDFADIKYPLSPPSAPLISFFMPRVSRLLLSSEKHYVTARPTAESVAGWSITARNPHKLSLRLHIPATASFLKPGCAFIFKTPDNKKFAENFSQSRKCASNHFNFRHRTRTYSFPYQPEHTKERFGIDFRIQEEPLLDRMTFLDQAGFDGCYLAFARLPGPSDLFFDTRTNERKELQSGLFAANIAGVDRHLFCERKDKADARLDYEKSRYQQHIDKAAFATLIDESRLKLRKFKHIRSQISGYLAKDLFPAAEKFSGRTGYLTPNRLFYDNLHWIILLRSYIELAMHAQDFFDSKMVTASDPRFSGLKASFSANFCGKQPDAVSASLQPAEQIHRYALSTLPEDRIALAAQPPVFYSYTKDPGVFMQRSISPVSYDCTEVACDFKMSASVRPEYRRNIELYILHMAIAIEDYDLVLGVSGRSLTGETSVMTDCSSEYRHPHLPEWLDLPVVPAHKAKMSI